LEFKQVSVLFSPENDSKSDCDLCALYNTRRKKIEKRVKLNAVVGGISEVEALTDLARESLLVRHAIPRVLWIFL